MSLSRSNNQPELGNTLELPKKRSSSVDVTAENFRKLTDSVVTFYKSQKQTAMDTLENFQKLTNSVVTYNRQKQTAADGSSAHYANMVMEEINNLMDTLNRYARTKKARQDDEFPRLIATLHTTAAHMNTILHPEQQKPEQTFNINEHLNELNTLSSHYSYLGNEGSTGRKIAGALMIVGGLLALAIAAAAFTVGMIALHGAALPFAAALVAGLVAKFGVAPIVYACAFVSAVSLVGMINGLSFGSFTVHRSRERGVIGAFGLFKDAVKAEQKEVASIEHQPEVLAYAAGAGA